MKPSLLAAAILPFLAKPLAAAPKPSDVLVSVNGEKIRRSQVADRLWQRHATQVLNDLVDEALVGQKARALGVSADVKQVEARLGRIQAQFPDPATFQARLAAQGLSPAALRGSIEAQLLREALVTRAGGLAVAAEEVRAFFNANKDRLGSPEALRLSHILLATEKEANDFLVAIRAGADFARLAGQISLDQGTRGQGGDLGFVSRGMILPEIEQAVWPLKAGEVAGPVRTQLGWHLFKAEERRPARPAEFAQVQGDLAAALLADKVGRQWPQFISELRAAARVEAPAAGRKPPPPR